MTTQGPTDFETGLALPKDEWAHYERAALYELRSAGIDDLSTIVSHVYENDAARFRAWLAESIVFCVRSIRRGEDKLALRGLCQVYEYNGRIGGWWGSPAFHDAALEIKNYLERKLGA